MKLKKQANGKTTAKMSRKEWLRMGKEAGWMNKEALGEAGEAYVAPEGGVTTAPPAGTPTQDVHLSEQGIIDLLKQNFGWTITPCNFSMAKPANPPQV